MSSPATGRARTSERPSTAFTRHEDLYDALQRGAFFDKTVHPAFLSFLPGLRVAVHAEGDHPAGRAAGFDLPGGGVAIQARHLQVHQDRLWLQHLRLEDRLLAAAGFSNHIQITAQVQQDTEILPDLGIVIDDQETDCPVDWSWVFGRRSHG
jgi:hypothetical protein